jgi:hypothetical protein
MRGAMLGQPIHTPVDTLTSSCAQAEALHTVACFAREVCSTEPTTAVRLWPASAFLPRKAQLLDTTADLFPPWAVIGNPRASPTRARATTLQCQDLLGLPLVLTITEQPQDP